MFLEILGLTHKGMVRENNEDSFAAFCEGVNMLPNLAVVADGMGGHQAGEIASRYAIEFFVDYIKDSDADVGDCLDMLTGAVAYANEKVYEASLFDQGLFGMGTTFTAATIIEGRLYVAHVGDSRLYAITEDSIKLITTDHTYTGELQRAGIITLEEAHVHPRRHALTKALGIDNRIEVDGYCAKLSGDEILLLCSDGLTEMISDEEIFQITTSGDGLMETAQTLILRANENGGVDNITVILAKARGGRE